VWPFSRNRWMSEGPMNPRPPISRILMPKF
jgi:hypothetical protein